MNYNNQGRQVVHVGRYTMTYTKVGDQWQIIMRHNTSAGEDPQPVRGLRDGRLCNKRLGPDTTGR